MDKILINLNIFVSFKIDIFVNPRKITSYKIDTFMKSEKICFTIELTKTAT